MGERPKRREIRPIAKPGDKIGSAKPKKKAVEKKPEPAKPAEAKPAVKKKSTG